MDLGASSYLPDTVPGQCPSRLADTLQLWSLDERRYAEVHRRVPNPLGRDRQHHIPRSSLEVGHECVLGGGGRGGNWYPCLAECTEQANAVGADATVLEMPPLRRGLSSLP